MSTYDRGAQWELMSAVRARGGQVRSCATRYDHAEEGRVLTLEAFYPGTSGYAHGDRPEEVEAMHAIVRGEVSEGRAGSDTTPVGPISPDGTVTGGSSRPTPLADLRDRFRQVLADHGRVSIDDLDQVIEDLIEAVSA